MRKFTEEELAKYDGKNGQPAYVGYRRKVYDVSASFLWQDGMHQVLHSAGANLTAALAQAPHSAEALKKFPVVGILRRAGVWRAPIVSKSPQNSLKRLRVNRANDRKGF